MNYLAILACGVEAVVLGFLWYGPIFGKPWRKTMGITDEEMKAAQSDKKMQQKMMKSAGIAFVGALVTAYVLRSVFTLLNLPASTELGIQTGFWMWLGFAVPVILGAVLWESKSWKWFFITIGYYLVLWLLMGVTLNLWG